MYAHIMKSILPKIILESLALACILLSQPLEVYAETRGNSVLLIDLPKHSIGTLERIVDGADYSDEHSPGKTFSQLSGRVSIAPNTFLGVTVRDSLSDPVPTFACLPTNQVQSLTLTGLAEFNERTIKSILRFKNIKRLQLDRAELDDKGLAMLATLPELESLVVSHTQITGTTLSSLGAAKKLSRLDIGSNALKAETLSALSSLKNLQNLSIGRCHLRNPHLAFLSQLTKLQYLDLFENALLSDPCMKYVSHLKNLKSLKIDGTHISQKGLLMLKGLPLKRVRVDPNMLSPAEEAQLQKAFPELSVKKNDKQTKQYGIFKELFEDNK
jgi:Leucine-rich repeat (LRR) protein